MTHHFQANIRRLWLSDRDAFRAHLFRLDPQSRRDRFHSGVSNDFLSRYAEKCFGVGDLIFGAFVNGHLCGASELHSHEAIWSERAPFARRVSAEAAFSVEQEFRRAGIGEALFARTLAAAKNHGVETIDIICQPDNTAMLKLAAKFSTKFHFEGDRLSARLTAARPTPLSLFREIFNDVIDFANAVMDAQRRALFPVRA